MDNQGDADLLLCRQQISSMHIDGSKERQACLRMWYRCPCELPIARLEILGDIWDLCGRLLVRGDAVYLPLLLIGDRAPSRILLLQMGEIPHVGKERPVMLLVSVDSNSC
jgi:hypothetical protein